MTDGNAHDAPLGDTIDEIDDAAGDGTVTLGELLDSFEDRSLGFVLVLFGLLVSLPVIGAVPGMPDVAATVILVSVFHSFAGGQQRFWAPDVLRDRELDADRVAKVLDRVRPWGRRIDSMLSERLRPLVASRAARAAIALASAGLAVSMFVLSLVPFLVMPAAVGILLFGLALMGRDGAFALAGYGFALGSGAALAYAVTSAL